MALYYPCSENKGADQLRGYREADLRLCFRICNLLVFPRGSSFRKENSLCSENTGAEQQSSYHASNLLLVFAYCLLGVKTLYKLLVYKNDLLREYVPFCADPVQ